MGKANSRENGENQMGISGKTNGEINSWEKTNGESKQQENQMDVFRQERPRIHHAFQVRYQGAQKAVGNYVEIVGLQVTNTR